MKLTQRGRKAFRENGFTYVLSETLPHVHNHYIRDHLPRREIQMNGINVRYRRLGDSAVPWGAGHPNPAEYERGIINGLRKYVEVGDEVVIVGGGWGVSTMVAAKNVGESGRVYTYESSPKYKRLIEETASLNGLSEQVEVAETTVSHAVSTFGSEESSNVLEPGNLPECEILELDCEGAEATIIPKMEITPRTVIVETHGLFDSPTEEIVKKLQQKGYAIQSIELAEGPGLEQMCREQDVRVITATLDES